MRRITAAVVNQADVAAPQAYNAARQSQMWENTGGRPRRFKDELTTDLLPKQSHRCAYCCNRLMGSQPHRDHVAPKGLALHPEFTFEVRNLVLACYYCNSERKRETDTIAVKVPQYELCQFTIVHPILDNPDDHLQFVGHRGDILIQAVNGSAKGQTTIDLFDLASANQSKARAKDALFDADVAHLQGRWKRLLEQVAFAPLPRHQILKFRS
jgi:uncharacterized protein (TIGR02646 family)